MRRYSWEEISRHNNTDDCWVVVDGHIYDVTPWVRAHPGGDTLTSLAGEDISALFHSSHLGPAANALDAYHIGEVQDYEPHFASIQDDFLTTLKARVRGHFDSNHIDYRSARGNRRSIRFTVALLFACWALAYLLPPWGIAGAFVMGLSTCALIGSFGHEQIHGNLKTPSGIPGHVIDSIRWGLYIPFMPKIYFQYEHLKHHAYPMHPDHDYDVYALKEFVRLSPLSTRKARHAFQHLYAPLVYGNYIFLQLLGGYRSPFFDARQLLREKVALPHIVGSSLVAVIFHVALPVYLAGFWWALLCISVYFVTWQSAIYITSGLPHMTKPIDHSTRARSWARYVCETTANLKCGNGLFDWLTGGLNYHLAHHLLPSIPRDHLPAVNRIVEQVCREFDHPYREYSRFSDYYRDHYRLVKQLGGAVRA